MRPLPGPSLVIDLKTHIASLIAVFLAIGMGILVGVLVLGGGTLPKSERQTIHSLELQFTQMRERERTMTDQISNLQVRLDSADRFAAGVLPSLLAGRLVGDQIAVVSLGEAVPPEIRQAILDAGGSVASETTVPPQVFTPEQQTTLQQVLGGDVAPTPGDLSKGLAQVLAQALQQGDNGTLSVLAKEHILVIHGDYTKPAQGIVLVGNGQAADDTVFALPFVRLALSQKANIVGVETVGAKFSSIPAFEEEGISTVDNVDQPAGQVAMIYALTGTAGNWGAKADARDGILPPLAPPPTLVPTGTGPSTPPA